ncbi:MAG: aminomethyl-transferring glycine dehydrogenase subunit GcvPB [Chloroflexota bacterium]|nr:aminomethyl-transferring glycine dehydrogenase subunit GcvPB [Chloroflexota bacterium]
MTEPLIYEIGSTGRMGVRLPAPDVPTSPLPDDLLRHELDLPEVGELQAVRHFVNLSQMNHSIDKGFYPLGSCTMKYNPKVNEDAARLPGFAQLHPLTDEDGSQGALALMFQLQEWLAEIAGFSASSLVPAAGAQGELAGILMIRAYHLHHSDAKRTKILVPNSAHGTNPATVTMAGLQVVELPSDADGNVDLVALRAACAEHGDEVAGMMITVPSTLGLFDAGIIEIINVVHACGGLMYMDGANMNSLLGIVKPGQLGFDVMHYNLHKTFSTPHGGGGPGCGAVGVNEKLKPYLPGPVVVIVEDKSNGAHPDDADTLMLDDAPLYRLQMPEQSIGRLKAFWGNFGMHVRAYAYIRMYGTDLREVSRHAVLNANYIRAKLRGVYPMPYDRVCAHEFVIEGHFPGVDSVHALDISKRLMDYGIHPPTNYFPLIVPEALLIEPTETEDKATLDNFIDVMRKIADEAKTDPTLLTSAPHITPVKRLDEVRAAKQLVLCCRPIPEWADTQAGD